MAIISVKIDENLREVLEAGSYYEEMNDACLHSEQGFNDFDANSNMHNLKLSGLDKNGTEYQEENDEKRRKTRQEAITSQFNSNVGHIAMTMQPPEIRGQAMALTKIEVQKQQLAQNSVDPEKAKTVLEKTQEHVNASELQGSKINTLIDNSLTDSNGISIVTNEDKLRLQEEAQMSFVQPSYEEINMAAEDGTLDQLIENTAHLENPLDAMTNPHGSLPSSPAENKYNPMAFGG